MNLISKDAQTLRNQPLLQPHSSLVANGLALAALLVLLAIGAASLLV